jgi:hypothetical protein
MDCQGVAATLQAAFPREDIDNDLLNNTVYVNFAYLAAVVITPAELPMIDVSVFQWDQSGGVESEIQLGFVLPEYVLGVVAVFLLLQQANDDEVGAALAAAADD